MDKDAMFMAMWDELGRPGFRHREKYGTTFRYVYEAEMKADQFSRGLLAFVRKWLIVPESCWPIDFCGFGTYLASEINNGRALSRRAELILRMIRRFPSKAAHAIIFEHENECAAGDYGRFFKPSAKFQAMQHAKENDPLFIDDLQALHDEFKIDEKPYRDVDGIIRRSMVLERNRRPDDFYITTLDEEEQEFQLAFTERGRLRTDPFISMTWKNVRARLRYRDLVAKGIDTHHWLFTQNGRFSGVSNAIKNLPFNLMPDISDLAHYYATHGNIMQKLFYGTPKWAKAAAAGVGSWVGGWFVGSDCGNN